MIYEAYGYTYLSDGIYGDEYLGEFESKDEAVSFVCDHLDGMQYTGGSVVCLKHPDEEEGTLVFSV